MDVIAYSYLSIVVVVLSAAGNFSKSRVVLYGYLDTFWNAAISPWSKGIGKPLSQSDSHLPSSVYRIIMMSWCLN